jgi:uncharacterized protein (DUF2461 family)
MDNNQLKTETGATREVANELILITDTWGEFYPAIMELADAFYNELAPCPLAVLRTSGLAWVEENSEALFQDVRKAFYRIDRDTRPSIKIEDVREWRKWLCGRLVLAKLENEI